jgi:hypothetical protein
MEKPSLMRMVLSEKSKKGKMVEVTAATLLNF